MFRAETFLNLYSFVFVNDVWLPIRLHYFKTSFKINMSALIFFCCGVVFSAPMYMHLYKYYFKSLKPNNKHSFYFLLLARLLACTEKNNTHPISD